MSIILPCQPSAEHFQIQYHVLRVAAARDTAGACILLRLAPTFRYHAFPLQALLRPSHGGHAMRRTNYVLAGIVDAAVVLKDIVGNNHAEQLLSREGLPRSVIDRILGDDAFARRAKFHAPMSLQ